jgi:hypothetical protein
MPIDTAASMPISPAPELAGAVAGLVIPVVMELLARRQQSAVRYSFSRKLKSGCMKHLVTKFATGSTA